MRSELKQMELVDRYLAGLLSPEETAAFQERLSTDQNLRDLVNDQQILMQGMERLGVRMAVDKAYRSYQWGKFLPWAGGAVVVAVICTASIMMMKHDERKEIAQEAPLATMIQPGEGDALTSPDTLPDKKSEETKIIEEKVIVFTDTIVKREVQVLWNDSTRMGTSEEQYPKAARYRSVVEDDLPNEFILGANATDPEFPGGTTEMRWFLHKNLEIPKDANGKPWNGTVKVSFSIMPDGSVAKIKALRASSEQATKEAERVISIMPKWSPATRGGVPIESRLEVPIIFMSRMETMN